MSFNEAKKNVIYVDQCGVEEAEQAITGPPTHLRMRRR